MLLAPGISSSPVTFHCEPPGVPFNFAAPFRSVNAINGYVTAASLHDASYTRSLRRPLVQDKHHRLRSPRLPRRLCQTQVRSMGASRDVAL